MADTPHGGARASAGRPKGTPNKVPSRARVAQEALIEKIEPHLDELVQTALTLLRDPNVKPADKNSTLKLLLDAITRASAQAVVDGVVEAASNATVADLLARRPVE